MATALLVPLIAAAVPILAPIIRSQIIQMERAFGSKTGSTKFDNVLTATLKTASDLATAGKIPGQLSGESIAMMIESEVQNLKAVGVLTPETAAQIAEAPPSVPTNPQQVVITGGTLSFGPKT